MFPSLSRLEPVTILTKRLIRILGFNPGIMTLQGTNTYIIGEGSRRILLDTGEENKPEYISALKTVLNEQNANLAHIIITHWHNDHIGGLKDVFSNFGKGTAVWKFSRSDDINPNVINSVPIKYLENGQEFKVDGATLKVIHAPGHTTDHIVLHLLEDNSLFSGDCILGEGTAVFEDLYDYIKSLEMILNINAKIIYPGHGPTIEDANSRIESYISHRRTREDQIVKVLKNHQTSPILAVDIVKTIYTDVSPNLHAAAEINVKNHLVKLKKEGKVQESTEGWSLSCN